MLTLSACRFIGVSDLAAVRFSLPAQLLEPRPNLGMLLNNIRLATFCKDGVGCAWNMV
jgi:hypothetical protein